jgi:hypothetical protein
MAIPVSLAIGVAVAAAGWLLARLAGGREPSVAEGQEPEVVVPVS